jgi:myo-inositol 2-dehydrogenase/D-chiro-inositol 1-dehydrogenase
MIKLAVFGAGRIGQVHARNLSANPQVDLAYVVDPDATLAAQLAEAVVAQVVDEHTVFQDPQLDGVVIASSTSAHPALLRKCADAGKPVFCEKPISMDLVEASRCVEYLSAKKARCMMGFHRRYDPGFAQAHDEIRRGDAGEIFEIVISSRSWAPPPDEYIKTSGGLFLDQSIHDFDMIRYLFGEEIHSVYAVGGCLFEPRIGRAGDIDSAMITMVTRSGKLAQINNARLAAHGYDQRAEVFGTLATLFVDNVRSGSMLRGTREGCLSASPESTFVERYRAAYKHEMQDFVRMVNKGIEPRANHFDGLQAQTLAAAALKSYRSGEAVVLETATLS